MRICFFTRKMAASGLLAPVLLWLFSPWAKGAVGSPFLLPAPENTSNQGLPAWRGTNSSGDILQQHTGFPDPWVTPLEDLRISMMLGASFQLSASALMSAAFSGWGILLPLCQPHKLQIRGKAWKWLSIYVNGLTGSASALAFVALILWSYDQGLSAALILPLFLLLYTVMVTLLVVGTVVFNLNTIHQITDPAAQRLVDFSTPTGVILVTVTCSLLIRQVVKLEEQGCAAPVDLTPVVVGTAGMCFLPFTAIVAVHCADMKKRTAEDRTSRRENWKKAIQNGTVQFL
ncbi:uncharacterized protein LOC117040485 isoform X2 [Lacerta agilis]|uniref:uncharacterized protein LOC117040485 isoform X2 n=1 Tax=Lacerta agilis TaxID=80427 RepID=UPI00141994E3|nr:uncharacterized protein LOC117040485 isoform X2 [Lacerta agilis]